jgi:tripartite-type tricarboxylate transporter receptor subunit TctC
VGAEVAARAAPDGYTMMLANNAILVANPALYPKLNYDPARDFIPVTLVALQPNVLVVHPSLPVKSVKELIALAKRRPGQLNYASSGVGLAAHLAGELFNSMAGVSMVHVPYKGAGPALADLIGGQTQVMFPSFFRALPHVKADKLKALAIAGPKRSAQLPQVPTLKEMGVDGVEVQQWYGIFAPARTPKAVVDQLNKLLNQVLTDKDTMKRIEDQGADVETSTPEQFGQLVKTEMVKWTAVVQKAKIKPD